MEVQLFLLLQGMVVHIQLPRSIQPMLASIAEPFDSHEYTYEIKWDGYRSLAFLDSETKLQSRNLRDITAVFPELAQIHRFQKQPGMILDGEIIALRNGKPSFLELQKRGQLLNEVQIRNTARTIPVVYVAFDLIYLNYQPLFNEPIEKRRRLLGENLNPIPELILADYIADQGIAYFKAISEMGLEGVIAKKKGSIYLPNKRGKTWLKFKRKKTGAFLICGFVTNQTSRGLLSSLILGAYLEEKLTYFGMVGTGFSRKELEIIIKELQKITVKNCPFTGTNIIQPKNTFWTKPILACEVEYLELTGDGSLRHPSFKNFRPDIKPKDCIYKE